MIPDIPADFQSFGIQGDQPPPGAALGPPGFWLPAALAPSAATAAASTWTPSRAPGTERCPWNQRRGFVGRKDLSEFGFDHVHCSSPKYMRTDYIYIIFYIIRFHCVHLVSGFGACFRG